MQRIVDSALIKFIFILLAPIIFICVWASPAFACTGMYVGSEASLDGTSIIARSNDQHPLINPCYIKVYGGTDGEKLEKISTEYGFEYELPKNIHRFITLPSSECADNYAYTTSAINDCGVSISATLTGYCSPESLKYNPYVKGGICEDMFPVIVGACCDNAREGIELIAKIIDEKGSSEDNIIMISDQNECWYMEIYAGHQYCAVKAPDDCVCSMGNEFMLETIDANSPDVIYSKDLFSMPEQYGFASYDSDGNMNIFNTYVGKNNFSDYSHLRTWEGHRYLSPSTAGEYSLEVKYPLFYKPDNKVSLQSVMDFFRDRYQGTNYYLDKDNHQFRPIATESQVRTHILQTYKDVPADMACCEWLCWTNAEFSTFVPVSNIQSKFDDSYAYNVGTYNQDDKNAYLNFKNLNALCDQKRDLVGEKIQSYWKIFENYEIEAFKSVLDKIKLASNNKNKIQNTINDFCAALEKQANYDAKRLYKNVMWFIANTEETFNQKFADIHKGDLAYVPQKYDKFNVSFDVELVANLLNWNIDKICLQKHKPELPDYDNLKIGNEEQADNGGQEGYICLTKNGHTLEIHTSNGHRLSKGAVVYNGVHDECSSYLEDGKIYVGIDTLNKLIENSNSDEFKSISDSITSPNRSLTNKFNSFWDVLNSWSVLFQVLFVVAVVLFVAGITAFIVCKFCKSKK